MNEQYKHIPGYPGYRVSRSGGVVQSCWVRQGRIWVASEDWRALKPIPRRGYYTVNLSRRGQKEALYVHELVLEAHLGPRPEGTVCCHYDGNPFNNNLANLRFDTRRANADDARRHGTLRRGEAINTAKLREADVLEIRRLRSEGTKLSELAARFSVAWYTIRDIVRGRTWKHLLPHHQIQCPDSEAVQHRGAA